MEHEPEQKPGKGNVTETSVGEPSDSEQSQSDITVSVPNFANFSSTGKIEGATSLDRLLDINVTVTAELGRVTLPIAAVMKFGVGSVLELNRTVSEPVDLLVQGVRMGRGEVVVVGDRFAVRLTEISEPKKG